MAFLAGTYAARRAAPRPTRGTWLSILLALGVVAACSSEPSGPEAGPVRLTVVEGNGQYVLAGQTAELPLQVQATDASSGKPVEDADVTWTITSGVGAAITVLQSKTDGLGIAGARIKVGPSMGTYRIEARAPRLIGPLAVFEVFAVPAPVIESVSPATAMAGTMVTIMGRNFGSGGSGAALFGGLRGTTISGTSTSMQVRVPACALTRSTGLRVALGAVTSNTVGFSTVAAPLAPISLSRGSAIRLDDASDLECMPLANAPASARYLLVPQNARESATLAMRYELSGIATGAEPRVIPGSTPLTRIDAASAFEISLRTIERSLGPVSERSGSDIRAAGTPAVPAVGDRRDFNVLKTDRSSRRITAAVQVVSQHAVIYVDVNAPGGGLTAEDLAYFGSLFDDPIHATTTQVFGQPSDIDQNQRIIILFTPAVNQLTESNASGFIAGYFYGCDLVDASRCSTTNSGEIFFSMVPDPTGTFGGVRTRTTVLRTVPAVLAHEFQHMINFAKKGERLDVLWLSEGLAHSAEDLVGTVLYERGDITTANDFRRPNYTRAQLYLRETATTALVSEDSPGSLEQRGGAWLLVKYIAGLYGGNALLGRLTSSSATGAANIAQSTGRPWEEVYGNFAVALWADGAPDLDGAAVDPAHTFSGFDLRAVVGDLSGGFPLNPPVIQFQDFLRSDLLAAGSHDYLLIDASTLASTIHLAFTGLRGEPFSAQARPQLTLLRVR